MRQFLATWWILSAMGKNGGHWPDGAETALCRAAMWDPTSAVVHRYISSCVELLTTLFQKISGVDVTFKTICDRYPSHLKTRIEVPTTEDILKSADFKEFKSGLHLSERTILAKYRRVYSAAMHENLSNVVCELPAPSPAGDVPLEKLITDVVEKKACRTTTCCHCGITTGVPLLPHVCRAGKIMYRCTRCPRTFFEEDVEGSAHIGLNVHWRLMHLAKGSALPGKEQMVSLIGPPPVYKPARFPGQFERHVVTRLQQDEEHPSNKAIFDEYTKLLEALRCENEKQKKCRKAQHLEEYSVTTGDAASPAPTSKSVPQLSPTLPLPSSPATTFTIPESAPGASGTCEEVLSILTPLCLGTKGYEDILRKENVDMKSFALLSEHDLMELHFSLGDRKKIVEVISRVQLRGSETE
eukprot:TRINITY_DN1715_c0_g1_i1.p2 TRINITY_DN1715_c0_g1~~TRINITY_DN1715_c0_g1_i1.p2  ORF type:complete len:412 (-),score=53.97 TRINITY_DN1715_c0_g1_i1:139-1374(-)